MEAGGGACHLRDHMTMDDAKSAGNDESKIDFLTRGSKAGTYIDFFPIYFEYYTWS